MPEPASRSRVRRTSVAADKFRSSSTDETGGWPRRHTRLATTPTTNRVRADVAGKQRECISELPCVSPLWHWLSSRSCGRLGGCRGSAVRRLEFASARALSSVRRPSPDDCIAGRVQCIDKVVREMTKRFEPLASSCNHDAIFALTYLRVTEEYRRTVESPRSSMTHRSSITRMSSSPATTSLPTTPGKTGGPPSAPAWRSAFDAARDRAVSANGNLLLGINAHVQRDLPFVLYGIRSRHARRRQPEIGP